MATKDWKKVGTDYQNQDGDSYIYLYPLRESFKPYRWHIAITKLFPKVSFKDRRFKTKSQALAYAKAYMRKH